MDSLILASGAGSLAVTAGKISRDLCEALDNGRSNKLEPGKALVVLSSEIETLSGRLLAVDKTLGECHVQSLTLALIDDSLWSPIGNTMMDCKATLEALDNLLSTVRSASQTKIPFRRSNMHSRLAEKAREMEAFASKVHKSNYAMKVVLGVIQVSLSLRNSNDVSQDFLSRELSDLRTTIETTLRISRSPEFNNDPFAAQISRNLLALAKSANRFHVQASTTASTIYGGAAAQSSWGGSVAAELTDLQRERIELWNTLQPVPEINEGASGSETVASASPRLYTAVVPPDRLPTPGGRPGNEDDSDTDMDLEFVKNFEALAQARLAEKDYALAERYLRKATERSAGGPKDDEVFRILRTKLAMCCALQEKWDACGDVLSPLAKLKVPGSLPVFHLLHVVAIAQLQAGSLEGACKTCKAAVQGRKRLVGRMSSDYYESLQLLAAIYDKSGDPLEAEGVRHSLPDPWRQVPGFDSVNPKQYLLARPELAALCSKPPAGPAGPLGHDAAGSRVELPAPSAAATEDAWQVQGGATPRLSVGLISADNLGSQVGVLDTGKEFVSARPTLPPDHSGRGLFHPSSSPLADGGRHVGKNLAEPSMARPGFPAAQIAEQNSHPAHSDAPGYVFHGVRKEPSWLIGSASARVASTLMRASSPQPPESASRSTVRPPLRVPKDCLHNLANQGSLAMTTISLILLVDGACILAEFDRDSGDPPNALRIFRWAKSSVWNIKWYITNVTTSAAWFPKDQTLRAERLREWDKYSLSMLRLMEAGDSPLPGESGKKLESAEQVIMCCIADLATVFWTTYRSKQGAEAAQQCRESAMTLRVPDQILHRAGFSPFSLLDGTGFRGPAFALPQSLAVASNFVYSQVSLDASASETKHAIVVLHCGNILAEAASYTLDLAAAEKDRKLVELESATSSLMGVIHVEMAFRELFRRKLAWLINSTSPKPGSGSRLARSDHEATMSSYEKLHFRRVFHGALDSQNYEGGSARTLSLQLPASSSAAAGDNTGAGEPEFVMEISADEIMACFESTVRRIRKTMEAAALRAQRRGHDRIHVIVGGSFSSSSILLAELRSACASMLGQSSGSGSIATLYEYGSLKTAARVGTLHHILAQTTASD